TEHVAVRMAQMELSDAPRLVGGRQRYRVTLRNGDGVHRVHRGRILEKPRHPDAVRLVVTGKLGHHGSARTLRSAAQKNAAVVEADTAEMRVPVLVREGVSLEHAPGIPRESSLPAERLEPFDTSGYAADVEDWDDIANFHGMKSRVGWRVR